MTKFIKCAIYYLLTGFMGFLFGRLVPKRFFDSSGVLYRPRAFEHGGRIYENIGIKRWQNKLPDMSRILPGTMPQKRIDRFPDSEMVEIMIRETCVSEFVHWVLCIASLGCFRFFSGNAGVFVYCFSVFVILLFIMIQRYNRPRLERLLEICRRHEILFNPADTEDNAALVGKN